MDIQDGPEADGCTAVHEDEGDDPETASLRALFPDGDPSTEPEWRELFG
jgi:hypothetical protein